MTLHHNFGTPPAPHRDNGLPTHGNNSSPPVAPLPSDTAAVRAADDSTAVSVAIAVADATVAVASVAGSNAHSAISNPSPPSWGTVPLPTTDNSERPVHRTEATLRDIPTTPTTAADADSVAPHARVFEGTDGAPFVAPHAQQTTPDASLTRSPLQHLATASTPPANQAPLRRGLQSSGFF